MSKMSKKFLDQKKFAVKKKFGQKNLRQKKRYGQKIFLVKILKFESSAKTHFLVVSWVSTSDARIPWCACQLAPPGGALAQTCWAPTDQGSVRHDNVSPRSRAPAKTKIQKFGPRPPLRAMALHATVDPPYWWRRRKIFPPPANFPHQYRPIPPPSRWRFRCCKTAGKSESDRSVTQEPQLGLSNLWISGRSEKLTNSLNVCGVVEMRVSVGGQ